MGRGRAASDSESTLPLPISWTLLCGRDNEGGAKGGGEGGEEEEGEGSGFERVCVFSWSCDSGSGVSDSEGGRGDDVSVVGEEG